MTSKVGSVSPRLRSRVKEPRSTTPAIVDPLREVRALKRWVQIGVYSAILGTEPFYFFVLHYSWPQLLSGLIVGLIIAFTAIEGAFNQIFKLRKRSAYPSLLLQRLSGASGVDAAVEQALPVVTSLLKLKASFALVREAAAGFRLVATHQMAREEALSAVDSRSHDIERMLTSPSPAPCHAASGDLRGVFVPVMAFQRPVGLIALCAHKRGSDLRDSELLQAIGTALGLSIQNLRQKEELAESEKRFRALIENSSDGIVLAAPDGKFIYAAPSTERILGYSAEEMLSLDGLDLVHPDDRQEMIEAMSEVHAEPGVSVSGLRRFRHRDGSWRWLESTATNLLHDPSVRAVVATARDVT